MHGACVLALMQHTCNVHQAQARMQRGADAGAHACSQMNELKTAIESVRRSGIDTMFEAVKRYQARSEALEASLSGRATWGNPGKGSLLPSSIC